MKIVIWLSNKIKTGFTSYQIKLIALFFMTLDHLASYGFEIAIFKDYISYLRILGRIAAPLFLYMVVESVRHTRNKVKYILRLYLAGVVFTGLFLTFTNFYLGNLVGVFSTENIMCTLFYTALMIYIIENILYALANKNIKKAINFIFILLMPLLISQFLYKYIDTIIPSDINLKYMFLIQNLRDSFIPTPIHCEYTFIFILLGIILYFMKSKNLQCITYFTFCLMGFYIWRYSIKSSNVFFEYPQYWMILALPFMLLYNGKRGKNKKYFFYLYYPIHRYIISIIFALYGR